MPPILQDSSNSLPMGWDLSTTLSETAPQEPGRNIRFITTSLSSFPGSPVLMPDSVYLEHHSALSLSDLDLLSRSYSNLDIVDRPTVESAISSYKIDYTVLDKIISKVSEYFHSPRVVLDVITEPDSGQDLFYVIILPSAQDADLTHSIFKQFVVNGLDEFDDTQLSEINFSLG